VFLLSYIFKFLFILKFDVAVAPVFITNSASQKYVLYEGSCCGRDSSHCGKLSIICLYASKAIYSSF